MHAAMTPSPNRFATNNFTEFLLLVLDPDAVFAMNAVVKSLHSVMVCYDMQEFYKRHDDIVRRPTAADSVSLDEFVSYCDSKIQAEFATAESVDYQCRMTVSDLMRMDAWARLYNGVGPCLMKYLLFGCLLFVPLEGYVYYCVRTPSQQPGHYAVLQSFRDRAYVGKTKKQQRGNGQAKTAPVPAAANCFSVAALLKATRPVSWGTDADAVLREMLPDCDDGGDTRLAALKSKLKVMADRDSSLRTYWTIYRAAVGDTTSAEIPLCRVKRFATAVVRKIVPRQLFGEPRNRDRYCENLRKVLNFGKFHTFTAQHVVHGIKANRVGWLKTVVAARRVETLTKALVWLTNSFVFGRIFHFFRVVTTNTPSHGIAYYAKARWAAMCHDKISPLMSGGEFFKELRGRDGSSYRDWNLCPNAKPDNGVRLIFKLRRKEDGVKQLMDHCLTFLRCLARTYPPEFRSVSRPQFFRGWKALQQSRDPGSPVYYVRTDFRDAFTSFKQDKLQVVVRNRIREWFGNKSQALHMISVDVVKIGGGGGIDDDGGTVYCKKLKYCGELPTPNFPRGSLVFYDSTTVVQLDSVWTAVRKCIRCNAVQRGDRRWAMTRGIVQGDRLSVALCDLLLANLQAVHLKHVVGDDDGSPSLYRFVDDYVFVSSDRAAAQRFLAAMCAGFDEYGLQLNQSKTQTNLLASGGGGVVKFLGFRFNAATGEVTKDISACRNQRPLHFFDYDLGNGRCGRVLFAKITQSNQHPVPVALVCKALNSAVTVARNLAFVVAHKAFAVVAAVKQYFFHLNPVFLLRTVHAVGRLMYGKVHALIRHSAITPMQSKWIVYSVYATMFSVHFSDCDHRVTWIVDQLYRCRSVVSRKCNDRVLKAALMRCEFAKMFG